MTTVAQFIDRCSSALHSYTGSLEQVTYLTTAIDADDLSLVVKNAKRVLRGIIEVGDELMRVDEVTTTSVELLPDGRGEAGSTAVTHPVNTRVISDPLVPRVRIFEAAKDALRQVQPHLFAVKDTTLTYSPVVTTYDVPAEAQRILRVQFQEIGPTKEWPTVRNWRFDEKASGSVTGKTLVLNELLHPGRTVQVVYAAPFTVPNTTSETLEVLGVAAEIQEVLFYGVLWRCIQLLDPARLQLQAVEQQARYEGVRPGDAAKLSESYRQTFMIRLAEERKRLLDLFPPTIHHAR